MKMINIEYCIVCGAHIGKGHDPAICGRETCILNFEIESFFNAAALQEMIRHENTLQHCEKIGGVK